MPISGDYLDISSGVSSEGPPHPPQGRLHGACSEGEVPSPELLSSFSQTCYCTIHLCCICSHLTNLHSLRIISDCRKLNIKHRVILQRHNFCNNFCINLSNNYKAEMAGTNTGCGFLIGPLVFFFFWGGGRKIS